MDIRTLRNKKSKSRNARPYDRPNQSLLGKVASKVKGILYPSWFSTWMSSGEEQGSPNDPSEEESGDEEDVQQISTRGSKRPRLRLHDHSPPILSEGTQTWLDTPSTSSIFNQASRMPSTVTQSTLMQNKESAVMMNGDDHSENSEESASTSGCSSLVSHKDRSNCIAGANLRLRESELETFRGQLKDVIGLNSRQSVTSQNESLSVNVGSSRLSLWSGSGNCSPATNMLCRSPSVVQRSQPGFNVSAFIGPSKLNQSTDGKISSPFYQGKTTFGGASSIRRMPVSVAPYQVDKPLRNQVKVRSNQSDHSLEGMSSAAKRILMTLEKMSSPVTDAKKIPNTNKSPVDLSLYLMPPKHRSNVVSTPTGTPKGPPIANISTISKLTTLKSCGLRRFQNSNMESLPVPVEEKSTIKDSIQQDVMPFATKSGGGKMRSKLTQQHQSSAGHGMSELFESTPLPNIPLPISTLPTFNFESKTTPQSTKNTKTSEIDFVFSNPIVVLPKQTGTLRPTDVTDRLSQIFANAVRKDKSNDENQAFTFARPIELEPPFAVPSTNISNSTMWECSSCWVRNPSKEPKCLACETPKSSFGSSESTLPAITPASIFSSATRTWECSSCWIRNPVKESKCMACEEPQPGSSSSSGIDTFKSASSGFGSAFTNTPSTWECNACWIRNPLNQVKCLACEAPRVSEPSTALPSTAAKSAVANPPSTWECSECWVRNPIKEAKCLACETPNSSHKSSSGENIDDAAKSLTSNSNLFIGAASSASSGFFSQSSTPSLGFKVSSSQNGPQTVSFGGFKIPVSKPSDSEEVTEISSGDKEQQLDAAAKTASSAISSVSQSTLMKSSSNLKNAKGTDSPLSINGPNSVSSLSHKSTSKVSENFSFGSEKEKMNGNSSFKSNSALSGSSPLSAFSTKPTPGFSVPGGWECDVCLVRISADTQICPACETHRPTKKNTFGLKDPDIFKFSSPLQGSPIAFKFGTTPATSVLDTSTTTTSSASFTFSTPISTASGFFAPVSSTLSKQKTLLKSLLLAKEAPATKLPVPEFKFDTPKLPSAADTAKPSIPVINLVDKIESSDAKQLLDLSAVSKSTASSSGSFAFSASKSSNTNSTVSSVTFSTPASTECNIPKAFVSSNLETSSVNILQVPDSKKLAENTTSGQSSLPTGGFNFKIPSTVTLGGLSTPNSLVSKTAETVSEKTTTQKQPLPKVSESGLEKKTAPPFVMTSSTPSLVSPFGQSAPTTSMFNVSDSVTPKSSTESSSLVKSCFAIPTTSSNPTASSFSFGYNSTGAFSLVPSSAPQPSIPTASNLLQFQSGIIKNQDMKVATPVSALSSTLTSSTFTFGDSTAAATQPSVTTGFTFFSLPATSTTTTSSGSNLFSFGSTSQASKPGGFTFKSTTEEKPNPVSSNSISFGTPTTTTSSSTLFKFGATAPASTGGFVFGAVKTEPVTTASSGFSFGSATTNPSTFSGFQPPQPATAPVYQFGTQPAGGTAPAPQFGAQPSGGAAPAPQFGANNFTFGTKSEATNPLTQPASGAVAPASGFGGATMQPMFGNTPAMAFGKTDKPGFNFGAAATGAAPVFQFGHMEKKPAAPQFSFSTPSQEAATPNSFVPTFNISTPTNFNFGAASSSVQPFQFAASSDASVNSSAHRKIRKAVRRVQPKH